MKISIYNMNYEKNMYPDLTYETACDYTISIQSPCLSDAVKFLSFMTTLYGGHMIVEYGGRTLSNGLHQVSGIPVIVGVREKVLA
ncbi:MAG: hypothetical protein HY831_04960 [Candidatus Aenigmarchaeota archaeon]|nr:hypothetical protein [Candidatus Aenigmarchaeota archaeon]